MGWQPSEVGVPTLKNPAKGSGIEGEFLVYVGLKC